MLKIANLSHIFKWDNLHDWRLSNIFCPTVGEDGHGKVDIYSFFRDDMNHVDNAESKKKYKSKKYKHLHKSHHQECHLTLRSNLPSQACMCTC